MMNHYDEDFLNFDEIDFVSEDVQLEGDIKYRSIKAIPSAFQDIQVHREAQSVPSSSFVHSFNKMEVNAFSGDLKNNYNVTTVVSSCPSLPSVLARTSFSTDLSFPSLKEKVDGFLMSEKDFDSSFLSQEHMWVCKFLHGSICCEMQISCFKSYDSNSFTIEVRRIRGEGFEPSVSQFFARLQAAITNEKVDKKRAGGLLSMKALPLPKLSKTTHVDVPSSSAVTQERFLEGVRTISSMVHNECKYMEPRLEAAKMLCDLANKDRTFIEVSDCRTQCVRALENLLNDEYEQIKEFAVMSISSFAECESYCNEFSENEKIMRSLLSYVRNSDNHIDFSCKQLRRKATFALSMIGNCCPERLQSTLCGGGYNAGSWMRHAESLVDAVQQMHAKQIHRCFGVDTLDMSALLLDSDRSNSNVLVIDSIQA